MFTNEPLNIHDLPRYEKVPMHPLSAAYAKVVVIRMIVLLVILLAVCTGVSLLVEEAAPYRLWIFLGAIGLIVLSGGLMALAFRRKGYAFREHDVMFRSGIIATGTMIIPYNRIQHVSLHEGVLSRIFGLATVKVFTAGGHQSDLEIPGIRKPEAENIQNLLLGKIRDRGTAP